jgi:hypothetical protein
MDEILEKVKLDWLQSGSRPAQQEMRKDLSVLQVLEESVGESEELGEILEMVRSKVESGSIDENDFKQIYDEIAKAQQKSLEQEEKKGAPPKILDAPALRFILNKEISKAKRYGVRFAVLSFSVVKAIPKGETPEEAIKKQSLIEAILRKLSMIVRDSDVVGELGENKMVVLLPMTPPHGAKVALGRCLRLLHKEPIEVGGNSLTIKVAGIATNYDFHYKPDMKRFTEALSVELRHTVLRLKSIHEQPS